jgi:single-strand DNA-binding protein
MSIDIHGRLTGTPELKYLNSGTPAVRFSVAVNRRYKDKTTGEWRDGSTSFHDCQAYGPLAENIAEHLDKGDLVLVTGEMEQRSYETKAGEKRTVWELNASDVGKSLKFASNGSRQSSQRQSFDEEPPF